MINWHKYHWKYNFKLLLYKLFKLCNEEVCQRCGKPVGCVWYAHDELWKKVTCNLWQILCPQCFGDISLEYNREIIYFHASLKDFNYDAYSDMTAHYNWKVNTDLIREPIIELPTMHNDGNSFKMDNQ